VTQGDVVVVQGGLSAGERSCHAAVDTRVLTSLTSAWPGMPFVQRYAYTTNPGSGDGSLVWEDYAIAPLSGTITDHGYGEQFGVSVGYDRLQRNGSEYHRTVRPQPEHSALMISTTVR